VAIDVQTTWEYKLLYGGKHFEDDLNRLGADGWELVSVTAQQTGQLGALSTAKAIAYLKRPR
jgi:hypothetical protein